jgi:branched-subunit amino acid transport protein
VSVRTLLLFVLAGVGTYLLRASLIVLLGRVTVPVALERSFRYIAPAVLAAIVAPALLLDGEGRLDVLDVRVAAGVAAGLAAWRWRTIPATLAAGLGVYWLIRLLT